MIEILKKYRIGQFIILFFIFQMSALGQTTYYVSNSVGDDNTGDGSIDYPFETIGKAISEIDAGGSVIIRGGVYHEQILIDNLNSSISYPTLIKSFDGETVVIDGTIEILGQWNDDNSNSSIKVVNGINDHITQLFVGNEQMVMARWPNAQFDMDAEDENGKTLYIFDKHSWAEGHENTSLDGQLYIDESKKNPEKMSNIFFNMFNTSPKTVIKFLSNKSNYLEDVSIILRMPKWTFIKALFY